jgi:hypothetical protein
MSLCATDENQGLAGGAFDGIWGDFGRPIGRGGLAEGLRTAPVRPARPAPARIGVVVAGFCARVVAVVVVDVGERR